MIGKINHIKIFYLIIAFTIGACNIFTPKEVHAGADSLVDYESRTNTKGIIDFALNLIQNIYICAFRDLIIIPSQHLNNTCIPRIITSDSSYEKDCNDSGDNIKANSSFLGLSGFIILLIVIIAVVWIPIVGQVLFIAGLVTFILDLLPCLGSYVIAPHEYINGLFGRVNCQRKGNKILNLAPNALTIDDVPFFYNCADQPINRNNLATEVQKGTLSGLDAIEGYGNMNDPSMPYCQGGGEKYALNNLSGSYAGIDVSQIKVGAIIYGHVGQGGTAALKLLMGIGNRTPCDISQDRIGYFNMTEIRKGKQDEKQESFPYYRLHNGKVQLCVAHKGIILGYIIGGCTYVPPPIEAMDIDQSFTAQTRCSYFLSTRSDLQSLGSSINTDKNNPSPVSIFLQSDFHMISTVVGCIQDLLIKVVLGTADNTENSFLYSIQDIFKGIIYVVLILYISVLGIKIMSNPNPPQMGEVVMYIMKFAIVFGISGLGGQNIWYNHDNNQQSSPGLYVMLLDSMNLLSNAVLESTNNLAPVNMCYTPGDDGRNILSQRSIPASPPSAGTKGIEATTTILPRDQNKVIISIWDFVDCKLASYLNLNSCKYTMSGMISMWLMSISLFIPSVWLLAIATIIFAIMLLDVMLRFVQLSIISMFAITILVLVSPIISCFLLFDFTKETFKSWFKMLLGYILYPALMLSLLALMIVTFDAIFYGQPIRSECIADNSCSITDICGTAQSDNNSLYCTLIRTVINDNIANKSISANMCNSTSGQIFSALHQTNDISIGSIIIFRWNTIKDIIYQDLFIGILKMALFVILFYNMMNSIMDFFERLLSIHGISNMAPSYLQKAMQGGKQSASAATSGASETGMQLGEKAKAGSRSSAVAQGGNNAANRGGGNAA